MAPGVPLGSESPFSPASPFAASIAGLFGFTLVVCAVIGVGVSLAIGYCLVRFPRRANGDEPSQLTGNRALEVVWTLGAGAVVVGLFVLSLGAMRSSDPAADRPPDVTVIGHQWWWEARYPSGAVTANEVHIPVGTPILVRLESRDVIHDFWVPKLGRKMDAVPGHANSFWIAADAPGSYGGACAEYCGAQHAWMRLLVVAQPKAEFEAWQAAQLAPAAPPAADASVRGERAFRDQACGNCHAIQGRGFEGRLAPDLTHLASRDTLGAGVIDFTPQGLADWLRDPQAIKPGCRMPDFNMSEGKVADLATYLEGMR